MRIFCQILLSFFENVSTTFFDNPPILCYTVTIFMKGMKHMKKILIFSDTHGYIDSCINIISSADMVSAVIHAGDCADDADDLISIFPHIPIYHVKGNNDFYTGAPSKLMLEIGGKNIFVTHGHEYRVKYESDYRTLAQKALDADADLAIFGHTHIPYTGYIKNLTLLNPGSIRFSRTYAIAEIDGTTLKTKILDV